MDQPLVTLIQQSKPVAAKQHSCVICGLPIQIGESHSRITYRDDDSLDRRTALRTVRFHFHCPPLSVSP